MAYLMLLLVSCLLIGSLEAIPSKFREKRAEGVESFEPAISVLPPSSLDLNKNHGIDDVFSILVGNSTKIAEKILEESFNMAASIAETIKDVEIEINIIYRNLSVITEGQANLTKDFIHEFNDVKEGLRNGRQELRKLATETIILTQDVKDMLDHDDEITIIDVEESLFALKKLLSRTHVQLEKARTQYSAAIKKMDTIGTTMKEKIVTLDQLADENGDKYKKFETELRVSVYGGCAAVTTGCIISDVIGTFGICSAIATSTCWGISITSIEITMAHFKAVIQKFRDRAVKISEKIINGLGVTIENAVVTMENELDIIIRWEAISGNLDSKLQRKNFQAKVLAEAKRNRKNLVKNVNKLQLVAQEFIDQPPSLFF